MCGKEVDMLNMVQVEGTVLRLCSDCSRFGTTISEVAPVPDGRTTPTPLGSPSDRIRFRARRGEERDLFQELPALELLPDWPKRIRQAREKLGWSPEDLGKKLNEKKSLVLKLESGNFHPPDSMLRKVEHLLKIRLRANPGELG
jgi:putative transcription factor